MLSDIPFTKENLDQYLKELAREFRKRNGRSMPAEMILIGGASVIINYGFREMTYDMDPLTLERIRNAVRELYGSNDVIAPDVQTFLEQAIQDGNYGFLYARVREAEEENKEILLEYLEEKPGVMNGDNVNDVLAALKRRRRESSDPRRI